VENREKATFLKKIVDGNGLPTLSPLTVQLIELASDDRSSAQDLATIIEKDPGLTTRLLKLVGSAFFARAERVTTVTQAIVRLGFKKVRIMALSLSLRDTFPMGKIEGMDYDHFWKTSLYRALIAQAFARSANLSPVNPEEAFVGGLISEIGMLMLFEACPKESKKVFPGGNLPLEKAISLEEGSMGINHRELGSVVFRRWHFPDDLVESQRFFGPEALKPNRPMLCKIVELARMATQIVFCQSTDLCQLQEQTQSLLGLKEETVNDILSETFNNVEELAEQLRIEVDSQTDMIKVMENANRALARLSTAMDTSLQGLLEHVSHYYRSLAQISEEMAQSRREVLQNTLDAVAHEIRNPLLAIGGFAKRLASEAKEEDKGRQYAKIITQESERLERVLSEILDYSQVYEPTVVDRDLIPVVNKSLDEFRDVFHKRKIDIVRDFPQKPIQASVDIDGIGRVLRQLIKNSIGMIGNKDSGRVSVSVQPPRGNNQISITISDNGHPIPEDIRNALIDSNLSTKTFGLGLGLPMARKIIEAHDGRIEMEVQESKGNIVKLYLPIEWSP
jgi:HD-like signal output (HDOD) protein